MSKATDPPAELPLVALQGTPPLPGVPLTIHIRRPQAVAALRAAASKGLPVVLSGRGASLAVLAKLLGLERDPQGTLVATLDPLRRARVRSVREQGEVSWATVEAVAAVPPPDDVATAARVRSLKALIARLQDAEPDADQESLDAVADLDDPSLLADALVARLEVPARARRGVLEELDVAKRLDLALGLAGRAVDVAELAHRIEREVSGKAEGAQRAALLHEQLETIRRELGMARDPRIAALRERLAGSAVPSALRADVSAELDRVEDGGPLLQERAGALARLDLLLALPWQGPRRARLDLTRVRRVLDRDHRGQAEAKQRLLDALAPGVLRPDGCIPPICLVGPSGVGKSSLAEGLGDALGRPVVHVRLSGVADASDLWGQARFLPDGHPGRVLEALRGAGVPDPVLVLDGLDELALAYPGDLEGLLTPLLDPARRAALEDRWLGVPFDASGAVVVATLQVAEILPQAIADRLVEVALRGYLESEKIEIARDHLLPQLALELGLDRAPEIPDATIEAVIEGWTFESGVHALNGALRTILRRIAARRAAGERSRARALPADLPAILGPQRRHLERVTGSSEPGLAMGLAWTPQGGQVLFIEAAAVRGTGRVKLTGSLGEVMKESAEAAITWLREHAPHLGDTRRTDLHVHVPAGAVPKDGPSAGAAVLVAVASALCKRPARHDLAMSGEITLRGQILPVGGIREKVMAAPRSGIRTVLLPRANAQDLAEIPAKILAGLTVKLVDRIEEVLAVALGAPTREPKKRRATR
jgi:ATP-dependent Lon protease